MKISKALAIGCAALMGLTATTPLEARSYRRVRIDDDGRRIVRTVRSRPRVVYRGVRTYPRYSRYYRSYPRHSRYYRSYPRYSRYYRSPRHVRYVRQPRYYSRWNTYPRYYSSYPSYYGSPFYYGSPYYYGRRGGVSITFGGGRYWGW